jgi:lactate dehydrogenase-like 2-hydroxyacid dehydrogenase
MHPGSLPAALEDYTMSNALSRARTCGLQVVSLHCALDEKTTHLINKERLGMMKEDAVLVNAARGPVVDEVALVEHLKANPNFRRAALAGFGSTSQQRTAMLVEKATVCS